MRTITKAICLLLTIGVLLGVGVIYLFTHGIQDYGWLCVMMTSNTNPADSSLINKHIPLDDKSYIRITTISRTFKADGSVESYRIHADVYCKCKQWLSMNERGWSKVYLASAQRVHDALRVEAAIPVDAVTHMDSELLLP